MRNETKILFAVLTALTMAGGALAWEPAKAPLMTKWGKAVTPENAWRETIRAFAETNRSSYAAIQTNRPDRVTALRLMREYVENCKYENCTVEKPYLESLGLKVPQK